MISEEHAWFRVLLGHLGSIEMKVERVVHHMATVSDEIAALVAADGRLQNTLSTTLLDLQNLITTLRDGQPVTAEQIAQLERTTQDLNAASDALAAADPGVTPQEAPPV